MDWKINPSIKSGTANTVHPSAGNSWAAAGKGSSPGLGSVWGGLGAPGPPSTAGLGIFDTTGPGAFPESGEGETCALTPSWIRYKFRPATWFTKVVCPAIQLTCWGWICVHQMDLQCSARGCSDGQWCNQSCTGKYLHEHSWKHHRSLCDKSQLPPLLTPRKETFTICNPKPTLFLIHGRLLTHFFFFPPGEWLIYNYL